MDCNSCGKRSFTSTKAARKALTGQLKSKRVRVYSCPEHPGTFHLTKESVTRIDHTDRRARRR